MKEFLLKLIWASLPLFLSSCCTKQVNLPNLGTLSYLYEETEDVDQQYALEHIPIWLKDSSGKFLKVHKKIGELKPLYPIKATDNGFFELRVIGQEGDYFKVILNEASGEMAYVPRESGSFIYLGPLFSR
jgi:hypothetical protein